MSQRSRNMPPAAAGQHPSMLHAYSSSSRTDTVCSCSCDAETQSSHADMMNQGDNTPDTYTQQTQGRSYIHATCIYYAVRARIYVQILCTLSSSTRL
eukprot:9572-Heterococcus_DN1.PRE.1